MASKRGGFGGAHGMDKFNSTNTFTANYTLQRPSISNMFCSVAIVLQVQIQEDHQDTLPSQPMVHIFRDSLYWEEGGLDEEERRGTRKEREKEKEDRRPQSKEACTAMDCGRGETHVRDEPHNPVLGGREKDSRGKSKSHLQNKDTQMDDLEERIENDTDLMKVEARDSRFQQRRNDFDKANGGRSSERLGDFGLRT